MKVRIGRDSVDVEMEVADADRLGLLCNETRVSRRGGQEGPGDADALVQQAGEMIRRVTYLQESLALIELDRSRGRAILRSANPRVDGDSIHYYEAVLEGGRSANLRRYRYDRGGHGRRAEPANLSTETASRLAGDLLDLFAAAR